MSKSTSLAEMASIAQVAMGLVFGWACIAKLKAPKAFARGIEDNLLWSTWSTRVVAGLVILGESFIALTHLTGVRLIVGIAAALCMLPTFVIVTLWLLMTKRPAKCLCFGAASSERISSQTLLRLLGLSACELFVLAMLDASAPHYGAFNWASPAQSVFTMIGSIAFIGLLTWVLELHNVLSLARARHRGVA